MWSLHGVGEQKFVLKVWVTWPRWPPHPYMVKIFESLLRNQMDDDLEIRYAALVALPISSSSNDDPWLTLTFFYSKVKFSHFGFCMEKRVKREFSDSIVAWFMLSTKWTFINTKGQGYLLAASNSVYLTFSPIKLLGWVKPNYMWSLHGIGEWQFVRGIWVTWSRWPPWLYGKNPLKISGLKDTWPYNLVCNIRDSGPIMFLSKWWPLVDLDLF